MIVYVLVIDIRWMDLLGVDDGALILPHEEVGSTSPADDHDITLRWTNQFEQVLSGFAVGTLVGHRDSFTSWPSIK